ncbi:MAG: hypothetical protein KGI25_10060, partial [Thaumarchaeota archaeon]|nr:hypothetical protein [Nitrososphaerota archaeon]
NISNVVSFTADIKRIAIAPKYHGWCKTTAPKTNVLPTKKCNNCESKNVEGLQLFVMSYVRYYLFI